MDRYLLFAGERYYPIGGWDDLAGQFPTTQAAMAHITDQEARSLEPGQPAGWRSDNTFMVTSTASIVENPAHSGPTWAVSPPDDAPPKPTVGLRPGEQYWWFPGRPATWRIDTVDWAHIVDSEWGTVVNIYTAGDWTIPDPN